MSGPLLSDVQALPIGFAPIGYAAPLSFGPDDVPVALQATLTAQAFLRVGQFSPFMAPPIGHDDPLVPAASRFVAARPGAIGSGALMRRFGIGRLRAGMLLYVLSCSRVCLGRPFRGVFRVNRQAWADLQGGV